MGRWPRWRDVRRVLSGRFAGRIWQCLVDFGAAHDPHAARYAEEARQADEEKRPEPQGPPPGHPERVRDDVPLSDLERRLARELWPAPPGHAPGEWAPGSG